MFQRRADWVWINRIVPENKTLLLQETPSREPEQNLYVYFRRDFSLTKSGSKGGENEPVFISADGRYELFVNGVFIGRGPARCHPHAQSVDPYDITPYLKQGKNTIAVLVHAYGRNTSWYEVPESFQMKVFGCGGFFFQGSIGNDGTRIVLDTNEEWSFLISKAWEKEVPFSGTGYVEYFHADLEPVGWKERDFDSTTWTRAKILKAPSIVMGSDIVPFPFLKLRDIPPLYEEIVYPQKIITVAEIADKPSYPVVFQLRNEKTMAMDKCKIGNIDDLIRFKCPTEIQTANVRSILLVFDFGLIIGRVMFEVVAPEKAVVDITYGERLTEEGSVYLPPDVPGISNTPAHRIFFKGGTQRFIQFEAAGFRYLQLTFRNCETPLLLKSVEAILCCYPFSEIGSFECSDGALKAAWKAGAYTVRMCKLDGFVDCPSREQRQWLGDVYVESLVSLVTEKDTRLLRKYLLQAAETQRPDGMLMMATTCDLRAKGGTFIPDFSLLWLITTEN
ncbi:MAG: family 78 glycoside hydrolase catalytic domain, partial [Spirochaetota bacterium]